MKACADASTQVRHVSGSTSSGNGTGGGRASSRRLWSISGQGAAVSPGAGAEFSSRDMAQTISPRGVRDLL